MVLNNWRDLRCGLRQQQQGTRSICRYALQLVVLFHVEDMVFVAIGSDSVIPIACSVAKERVGFLEVPHWHGVTLFKSCPCPFRMFIEP